MASRCKYPGCSDDAKKRGCCLKHYQKHVRAVAAGETTWAELESLGLVKPDGRLATEYGNTLRRARRKAKVKS